MIRKLDWKSSKASVNLHSSVTLFSVNHLIDLIPLLRVKAHQYVRDSKLKESLSKNIAVILLSNKKYWARIFLPF